MSTAVGGPGDANFDGIVNGQDLAVHLFIELVTHHGQRDHGSRTGELSIDPCRRCSHVCGVWAGFEGRPTRRFALSESVYCNSSQPEANDFKPAPSGAMGQGPTQVVQVEFGRWRAIGINPLNDDGPACASPRHAAE